MLKHVFVEKEWRHFVGFMQNRNGEEVVMWRSLTSHGVCVESVWFSWGDYAKGRQCSRT